MHTCHATGCTKDVPPAMFMCRGHWYALPKAMRDAIWGTYRRGQEDDKDPSREYCQAAKTAVIFLATKDGLVPDTQLYDMYLRDSDEA